MILKICINTGFEEEVLSRQKNHSLNRLNDKRINDLSRALPHCQEHSVALLEHTNKMYFVDFINF